MCCSVYSTKSFQHFLARRVQMQMNEKDGARLLTLSPFDRMRCIEAQTTPIQKKEKKLFLFFFYCGHNQTLEQWSRKFVETPSWEMLKIQLDTRLCASGSNSSYFEQVDWSKKPTEIFDNLCCTVSGWLWNLTLHCWHWNTHLRCGQLSFKNYSSRTFGQLKNWSHSSKKHW